MEKEPKRNLRILVVEDNKGPLKNIENALKKCIPTANYEIAKWFTQAKEMIQSSQKYDVILLDHRMSYDKPEYTEDEDFNRFCDQLENIGYGLIAIIKKYQPKAIIVGTSSLSQNEICGHGYSIPEKIIQKLEARSEIPRVFEELNLN